MSNRNAVSAGGFALAAGVAAILQMAHAQAGTIETGQPDLKVRWDNTFKYSAALRMKDPSQNVAASYANPNVDAGDLALDKGLINNRVDWLTELDVAYQGMGARVSAAAWYDTVYNKSGNDFPVSIPFPNTANALTGGANNVFTPAAKKLMGRKAELADAFVYGSTDIGDGMGLSGRVGRHTQLYGETLFLGANGIAYAQGPVDLIKLFSLPGVQFKEIALPVGQVSGNLQINSDLSVGAYYQYQWRALRLPAAGSYFSPADFVGDGADLLLTPVGGAASRAHDLEGRDSGQFGARVKFKVPGSEVEYGLYAAKYHDKSPIPVLTVTEPGAYNGGVYRLMYAQDVKVYGASFSTLIGETNVGGEMSTRRDTPLAPLGDLVVNFDPTADNRKNSPYAVGNSFHANLSAITVLAANPLWDAGSFVGELAFNRLLSVTRNPVNPMFQNGVLNTTHTRDAWAMRMVFQPEYFQVLSGLDLQVPIGLGYGISGRSAVFQVAPEHGGDLSVGVNFDYKKTWRAGVQFTHYIGAAGPAPSLDAAINTQASYKQYYKDRDFVTFSVQRTF
ncbi:DUF1302 domain-containing protein [Rugamonas apoptosis]|uniref:DUF1302 domain-containing protein n=1 Tax=Rugamonas apoptosis TaxID=2758570 RepID=A0A7W2FDV4_9BURK|nr:DUF1302 domain-containing protein [Rugamonas apoptosis]MBA5689856.1 DUF1302 domain-containing protein [Rugamonas apoptosis]